MSAVAENTKVPGSGTGPMAIPSGSEICQVVP